MPLPLHAQESGSSDLPQIPPEQERLLRARIDELFPNSSRVPLPKPNVLDTSVAVVSNLGYVPVKCMAAVVYTFSAFLHHAALEGREGRRILVEGWTGDWIVQGVHIAGAEPLDLVGPDRKFPGHNPEARRTFIRSYYLLYSSLPYRGIPEGSPDPQAAQPVPEKSAPANLSTPE